MHTVVNTEMRKQFDFCEYCTLDHHIHIDCGCYKSRGYNFRLETSFSFIEPAGRITGVRVQLMTYRLLFLYLKCLGMFLDFFLGK